MPVLRRAEAGDLDAIAAIQAASPEAAHWRPDEYLAYDCYVETCDGQVVGFLCARRLSADEWEILNLAVEPNYRRRGVARRLLEWHRAVSPGSVFLEVRESNIGARKFYHSLGFQELSRRVEYYVNPPEAAIVMKFHSC